MTQGCYIHYVTDAEDVNVTFMERQSNVKAINGMICTEYQMSKLAQQNFLHIEA
jgi:hypothetical protein